MWKLTNPRLLGLLVVRGGRGELCHPLLPKEYMKCPSSFLGGKLREIRCPPNTLEISQLPDMI
jgi:hypothetical protein